MRPRYLVCITLLAACHLQLGAQAPQVLTNTAPAGVATAAQSETSGAQSPGLPSSLPAAADLPDDPGQELVPQAVPEPAPATGVPLQIDADNQNWDEQSQT